MLKNFMSRECKPSKNQSAQTAAETEQYNAYGHGYYGNAYAQTESKDPDGNCEAAYSVFTLY
jgi:hypothetical protein